MNLTKKNTFISILYLNKNSFEFHTLNITLKLAPNSFVQSEVCPSQYPGALDFWLPTPAAGSDLQLYPTPHLHFFPKSGTPQFCSHRMLHHGPGDTPQHHLWRALWQGKAKKTLMQIKAAPCFLLCFPKQLIPKWEISEMVRVGNTLWESTVTFVFSLIFPLRAQMQKKKNIIFN